MERCRDLYGNNANERLDTIEGPYDLYDQEDDDEDADFNKLNEASSGDDSDGEYDLDNEINQRKKNKKRHN